MKKGYTLFEMSIVLIIISLLAASVLWGLSVLRQAQMRSVAKDLDHYQWALQTFYDRYNQLPGDMPNAESFWNNGDPCPGNTWTGVPTKITCNSSTASGGGDGKISPQDYDNGAPAGDFTESFRAWQQLYDAGFIDQAMTGTKGPAGTEMSPGLNVPEAVYGGPGYMLYYLHCTGFKFDGTADAGPVCTGAYFPAQYGHVVEVGVPTSWAAAGGYSLKPFISPIEAWGIDTKMDDGTPATGKVLAPASEAPNCVSATDPATAVYQVTGSTDNQCTLVYITGL